MISKDYQGLAHFRPNWCWCWSQMQWKKHPEFEKQCYYSLNNWVRYCGNIKKLFKHMQLVKQAAKIIMKAKKKSELWVFPSFDTLPAKSVEQFLCDTSLQ